MDKPKRTAWGWQVGICAKKSQRPHKAKEVNFKCLLEVWSLYYLGLPHAAQRKGPEATEPKETKQKFQTLVSVSRSLEWEVKSKDWDIRAKPPTAKERDGKSQKHKQQAWRRWRSSQALPLNTTSKQSPDLETQTEPVPGGYGTGRGGSRPRVAAPEGAHGAHPMTVARRSRSTAGTHSRELRAVGSSQSPDPHGGSARGRAHPMT